MNTSKIAWFVSAGLAVSSYAAVAQEFKVGYINKAFGEKFERDQPTLSESQRISRQKEGAELTRDLQRRQREFQEDLNGRRNEELQQVLDRATKAVKQVADAEKFDMVLQEVVYVNTKHDITEKVLKILNNGGK